MLTTNKKAACRGGSVVASTQSQRNRTASPASCAKWLAIWRYTHGYCSLEATQAAIDAHPEWRLARSLAGTT